MFNVNDVIQFGSRTVRVAIVQRVNRTAYSVKVVSDGTVWNVPFANAKPVENVAVAAMQTAPKPLVVLPSFARGQRVSFEGRNGKTVTGTVERVNGKTVTVTNTDDGERGWRVNPNLLTVVSGSATTAPVKPVSSFRVGQVVTDGSLTGTVVSVRGSDVNIMVKSRFFRIIVKPLPASMLRLADKRTDKQIEADIQMVYGLLEPETLTADGERPRSEVARLRTLYNQVLNALFEELGRRVEQKYDFADWSTHRSE